MENLISEVDFDLYSKGARFVANLSRLFSTSATPLVDSRFAEKLFCAATGSTDLSRSDMSFDALYDIDAGVGVKTFIAMGIGSAKFEKVAEFTTLGPTLAGLTPKDLVHEVARLRNLRVKSDASQYGIDLTRSFYHCLVRVPGKMFIHEEPYELVDIDNIELLNENPSSVTFTDGKNQYRFSRSKTVLLKRFDLSTGENSEVFATPVNDSIWDDALGHSPELTPQVLDSQFVHTNENEVPEFVILPLYSTSKAKGKFVAEHSGINQWNAGGRKRKFGEAYIPVPASVHKASPDFFPGRDVKFRLRLPDGLVVQAKICQDGGKALMSDPNETLCKWLFSAIDGSFALASRRIDAGEPYTYNDLTFIDKDAVSITKVLNSQWDYELEFVPTGSFEAFVDSGQESS